MTDRQLAFLMESLLRRIEEAVDSADMRVADLLSDHDIFPDEKHIHIHPTCFGLFCKDPSHMVSIPGKWALLDSIREVIGDIRAESDRVLGGGEARVDRR